MLNDKISVILPVYNVEKYLDYCMNTVINQTYSNLEIILVDDGATDSSSTKCDEWENRDSRVKVIHKKNAGLGYARNSGLDIATGKYVVFIDSDDWLDKEMIEKLYFAVLEHNADTVLCNFYRSYADGKCIEVIQAYRNKINTREEIVKNVLFEMIGTLPNEKKDFNLYMSVWHGIYSMDLIRENMIRFPSEKQFISEDIIFDIDYFRCAKKVVFIDDCLYYYRENANSLTLKYNPIRFEKEVILYEEVLRMLKKYFIEPEKDTYRVERMFLGRVRSCVMRATICQEVNSMSEIKKYCNNSVVKKVMLQYPYRKNPIQQKIFNFFLRYRYTLGLWIIARIVAKRNLKG